MFGMEPCIHCSLGALQDTVLVTILEMSPINFGWEPFAQKYAAPVLSENGGEKVCPLRGALIYLQCAGQPLALNYLNYPVS